MHIHKMKSRTRKRCSLYYTYLRNCSSTTKMKLTATQQDVWPTINSHRRPVTELFCMAAPNLNIQSQCLLTCDWLRPWAQAREFADTCWHWQEIPASPSDHQYRWSRLHVTFLTTTPHFPVLSWSLHVLHSITHLITIPVILQKKDFFYSLKQFQFHVYCTIYMRRREI